MLCDYSSLDRGERSPIGWELELGGVEGAFGDRKQVVLCVGYSEGCDVVKVFIRGVNRIYFLVVQVLASASTRRKFLDNHGSFCCYHVCGSFSIPLKTPLIKARLVQTCAPSSFNPMRGSPRKWFYSSIFKFITGAKVVNAFIKARGRFCPRLHALDC